MNYELVTEISLVAGIGFSLLAGVLFFSLEVTSLLRELGGSSERSGSRDPVRDLPEAVDLPAEATETMFLREEGTLRVPEPVGETAKQAANPGFRILEREILVHDKRGRT